MQKIAHEIASIQNKPALQIDPNLNPQIERRYQSRSGRLKEYRFPRKKQSVASSVASNSLNQPTYDLRSQNKKYLQHEFRAYSPVNTICEDQNEHLQKQKPQLPKQNIHIHILNITQIRELTRNASKKSKSKMKILSNKSSPDKFSPFKNQISGRKKPMIQAQISADTSLEKQTTRTKQKSKKKLVVLSSKRGRVVQSFKINDEARPSPRKGLQVVSRQKSRNRHWRGN